MVFIPGKAFQSTSSIQRKTRRGRKLKKYTNYFNPLPLYRGRHNLHKHIQHPSYFNPLPLYRGRQGSICSNTSNMSFQSTSSIQRKTCAVYLLCIYFKPFQSTSSIQRKTNPWVAIVSKDGISIHFLYTEEDILFRLPRADRKYFNPLPLYRGRQVAHKF